MTRPPGATLFPTRRSSDLRRSCAGFSVRQRALGDPGADAGEVGVREGKVRRHGRAGPTGSGVGAGRSEEHTSELQSQSNLVCRLRLEKKKIPKSPTLNTVY